MPYRLTVAVHMLGAIVLAVGINDIFKPQPSIMVAFIGFIIMRLALISQWLRAAKQHPERRKTCMAYAIGTTLAQVGWVLTLVLSGYLQLMAFALMVGVEAAVPYIAERQGQTPWRPHHIAERYGLLVIIVLGECITGIINIVSETAHDGLDTWITTTFPVIVSALSIVFSMWWTYFKLPLGELLEHHRNKAFTFGYIHYFVFASLAALGAGLGLLANYMTDESNMLLAQTVLFTIATACGLYLLLISIINMLLFKQRWASLKLLAIAIITPAIPMGLFLAGIPLRWAIFAAIIAPALYTYVLKASPKEVTA